MKSHELELRRIRADEGLKLRAIRLAALADSPAAFGSTLAREQAFDDALWSERAKLAASGQRGATYVLAGGEDAPWLGLVTVIGPAHMASTSTRAQLYSMWVAPVARSEGWARRLVEAAVDFARSIDVEALELSVTRGNTAALSLYQRCGFTISGPIEKRGHVDEIRLCLVV